MLSKLAYCFPFRNYEGINTKVEQARRINQLYARAARFNVRDYHFPLQFETWTLPPYQVHFAVYQLSVHRFRSIHSLLH